MTMRTWVGKAAKSAAFTTSPVPLGRAAAAAAAVTAKVKAEQPKHGKQGVQENRESASITQAHMQRVAEGRHLYARGSRTSTRPSEDAREEQCIFSLFLLCLFTHINHLSCCCVDVYTFPALPSFHCTRPSPLEAFL